MSLTQFIRNISQEKTGFISPAPGFPASENFHLVETLRNDRYNFDGDVIINPVTGDIWQLFIIGDEHFKPCNVHAIYKRRWLGNRWDDPEVLVSLPDVSPITISAFFTKNGRFVIAYYKLTDQLARLGYWSRYSNDNLNTISEETNITLPGNIGHIYAGAYGGIELDNGDLLTYLLDFDDRELGPFFIRQFRSTNGGISWFYDFDVNQSPVGGDRISESAVVNVGNGNLIMASRIEFEGTVQIFTSDDSGQTWTDRGNTAHLSDLMRGANVGQRKGNKPTLQVINIDGVDVVVFYWTNRADKKLVCVYGRVDEILLNGSTGFKTETETLLYSGLIGAKSGYQSVLHPNKELKGLGIVYNEYSSTVENIGSSNCVPPPLEDTEVFTFYTPSGTTHINMIKTGLNI